MNSDLTEVIRARRTIGSFRAEVPPSELIESALELARWAPNHKKTEPWRRVLARRNHRPGHHRPELAVNRVEKRDCRSRFETQIVVEHSRLDCVDLHSLG